MPRGYGRHRRQVAIRQITTDTGSVGFVPMIPARGISRRICERLELPHTRKGPTNLKETTNGFCIRRLLAIRWLLSFWIIAASHR